MKCKRCKKFYNEDDFESHECFIQKINLAKLGGAPPCTVFADLECFLEQPTSEEAEDDDDMALNTVARHKVALAVALRISPQCEDNWNIDLEDCQHCKADHKLIFDGENVLEKFLKNVLESPAGTICVFHNLAG